MDPQTSLSLVAQADKMLRGAALTTKDQSIALMWSGGGADPQKLEKVLRQCFDKCHLVEAKSGRVMPRSAQHADRAKPHKSTSRSVPPYRRRFVKRTYAVEDPPPVEDDEEESDSS